MALSMPSVTKVKLVPPSLNKVSLARCVTTKTGARNGGVVSPRLLPDVEHSPAHQVGAGRLLHLGDELRVGVVLAAVEAQAFTPGHGVDHPTRDPVETGV